MARKILPEVLRKLKEKDDNFFSMPQKMTIKKRPGYVSFSVSGLKPKTRYKVMLDNYPGNRYEDVTDFCRPVGTSIPFNLHRSGGQSRMVYLKTDDDGRIKFKARPFGSQYAITTGSETSGTVDWSGLWDRGGASIDDDSGRGQVRLIEYARVNNPDSADKIKTTNVDFQEDNDVSSNELSKPTNVPPKSYAELDLLPSGKEKPKEKRKRPIIANLYQTFYVDSKGVDGETQIDLTDVTLYFRKKPRNVNRSTDVKNPGVRIAILACDETGAPQLDAVIHGGRARLEYGQIQASPLATTGSIFSFKSPITVQTNAFYAIAVTFESKDYSLWSNTKGDLLLSSGNRTERRSSGTSSGHKGDLYKPRTTSSSQGFASSGREGAWQPNVNQDLKFDVHLAEYGVSDVSTNLVVKDYEFLALANTSSNWAPGEIVYKDTPAQTGTVTITGGTKKITGTSTTFTSVLKDGDKILLTDGTDSTIKQVFTVTTSIGGDTATPSQPASDTIVYVEEYAEQTITGGTYKLTVVGTLDDFNSYHKTVRLIDSSVNTTQYNANNDLRFAVGDTIYGIETGSQADIDAYNGLPLSVFRTKFNGKIPSTFKTTTDYRFTYYEASTNTYILEEDGNIMYLNHPNHIKKYGAEVLSRSEEVDRVATYSYGDSEKSAVFKMNYTWQGRGTRTYQSPSFNIPELSIIGHRWQINNDSTNEHTNNGNATTRHISKRLRLKPGTKAEDLKVVANIYRPQGTTVEFYAKIYNSADGDKFEDKSWTKLDQKKGRNKSSNPERKFDFFSTEWGLPTGPSLSDDLEGSVTTVLGDDTVTISGANTAEIDALTSGTVLGLYSPLFPGNYQISSVDSANGTAGTITFNEPIANSSLVGDGFAITTFDVETTAFTNPQNDRVVRYFSEDGSSFDGYDNVAIKIVLLSNDPNVVPKVDDFRCVAVSV